MSAKVKKEVEAFMRKLLTERLEKCTAKQKATFDLVYPMGVPPSLLEDAIDLCDRTIKKNHQPKRTAQAKEGT